MTFTSATITKASRTNFYYAFFFLPRAQRDALYAVYAFSRLVDDAVDQAPSPLVGAQQILYWRKELAEMFAGRPAHPVTTQLATVVGQFHIPRHYFELLIDGVEMDLSRQRYATFEQLSDYCYRVASVVGLICIEIFGYRNPAAKEYAVAQGMAFQLTNILRDIKVDAARGRIYIPKNELAQFGYSEAELMAGRYNEAFVRLMAFQADRAKSFYTKAARLLPAEDRATMLASEVMGGIYRRILAKIEERNYNVFDGVVRLGSATKLMIALRVWAREKL